MTTDPIRRSGADLATPAASITSAAPIAAPIADIAADISADGLLTVVDRMLGGGVTSTFACMAWAEEEIETARAQHPQHADRLFHSFPLVVPTQERMSTEFVYRSHCRELLGRVVAGEDTRPGTAAEVCCVMLQVSLATPLKQAAHGLYLRMWQTAGFPELPELTEASRHHEALQKATIDDHEQFVRGKLAVADRRLGDITCPGCHHGETVTCVYAATQPALDL